MNVTNLDVWNQRYSRKGRSFTRQELNGNDLDGK